MLLQTNSYFVPKDKRVEHARLLRRFRTALARVGCDHFEVYEQVGSNWNVSETTGRFVQIMRFRDRKHQQAVQAAEQKDTGAQAVIAEFCNLINFPYQQQQGLFAVGFYTSVLPVAPSRSNPEPAAPESPVRSAAVIQAPAASAVGVVVEKEPEQKSSAVPSGMVGGDPEVDSAPTEQGFGQVAPGDFEEAMQRLRPIDVSGAPGQAHAAPAQDEPETAPVTGELVEPAASSDEPAQPTWDATAELVEANEMEGISDDDALAELESDDFVVADILPQGEVAADSEAADTAAPASGDADSADTIFQTGAEGELSADSLNTELAHPENAAEFRLDDDDEPDSADHHNPGGRALR